MSNVIRAGEALRFGARVLQLYDDATMRADHMIDATEAEGILEALADYAERFGVAAPAVEPDPVRPEGCDFDVWKIGELVGDFDISKAVANAICASVSNITGAKVDYFVWGGRIRIKALPPPAVTINAAFAAPAADSLEIERLKTALKEANEACASEHRDRELARAELQRRYDAETADGSRWFWQGDGSDHLESMVNGMQVIIGAAQLRELLAPVASAQQDERRTIKFPDAEGNEVSAYLTFDELAQRFRNAADELVELRAGKAAQQDEREAWRQRAESMRNVAGDNALRVPPETMLALLAQQVQADAPRENFVDLVGAYRDAIKHGTASEQAGAYTALLAAYTAVAQVQADAGAVAIRPDHFELLRPFMSERDGSLTHSLTVYLREMADPEFAKRTHEARKRLYGAAAESDKRDGLTDVLRGLLAYAERNECHHEETHRGGAIWTICDCCGMKWADDEGGFKPYVEPKAIADARAILAAMSREQSGGGERGN